LRTDLTQFMRDLDADEADRKTTTQAELKDMSDQLRESLAVFKTNMSASVAGIMGELKKDRTEAAKAWNQILSVIRTAEGTMTITSPVEVETKVEAGTVSEAIEEEQEAEEPWAEDAVEDEKVEEAPETEQEEEESASDGEDLNAEIVSLLEDTPEGLRMVEIAETVAVENWRSLIPVMRELLEEGEVRKEDSTYYIY